MGPGKGMYILEIWTDEPYGVKLLMLRPWMSYDYIVIQIVCWVELPEQRRFYSIFVKIWIPINGT